MHLADSRLELAIKASTVTFPLLEPVDIGISQEAGEQFITDQTASCLNMEQLGCQSVLVLPKLSRARFARFSKKASNSSRQARVRFQATANQLQN